VLLNARGVGAMLIASLSKKSLSAVQFDMVILGRFYKWILVTYRTHMLSAHFLLFHIMIILSSKVFYL